MFEPHGVGKLAHRAAVAIGQDFQDAPLLDRHAFLRQPCLELPVDLPVGLREQVGDMFGNGSFWTSA